MEHKLAPMRYKKAEKLPPVHYCGYLGCRHYTESWEEPEGVHHWGEHCNAGCSLETMRLTPRVDCGKWEDVDGA